jgi:hypothetical protein
MYELSFSNRTFYAKTLDEIFNIIGEQDGEYSIRLIENT